MTAIIDLGGEVRTNVYGGAAATISGLLIHPDYRVDALWDAPRQRDFLRTHLAGEQSGEVVWASRNDARGTLAVLDGRQRLAALRDFFDDRLLLPATLFEVGEIEVSVLTDHGYYVVFHGLSRTAQRRTMHVPLITRTVKVRTAADEAEVFARVRAMSANVEGPPAP